MDKEITKKFVENTGFICSECGSIVVDGHKHDNQEDLCDKCKITDLEAKLAESEERLKAIDNWKENYGYTNYEDIYMLENLQSRAFQSEDDTNVVNELLNYLNISDENEILPTIKQKIEESDAYKLRIELAGADETISQLKQQLAEKDKTIEEINKEFVQAVKDWKELVKIKEKNIAELEEQLKEKDLAIDKFSKIDIWLMRKYGKKLYKDFNITNDDIDIKTFIKISQVFDNIYEEMNKEMPLMWFNYGFFGLPKLDKGE